MLYNTPEELKTALLAQAEPDYADFSRKLLPGVDDLLGVRLPALRKLARALVREDARAFLDARWFGCFEMRMLYGMALGCAPLLLEERLAYLRAFLPVISDWSVCDSTVSGMKCAKESPDAFADFLVPCFSSALPYERRFGFVMLLTYFSDDNWFRSSLSRAAADDSDFYYVRMAKAWLVAECFAAHPAETLAFLASGALTDDFTHNKAISKICDFRLTTMEQRQLVKALRRK